jgi:hypothetical protein
LSGRFLGPIVLLAANAGETVALHPGSVKHIASIFEMDNFESPTT